MKILIHCSTLFPHFSLTQHWLLLNSQGQTVTAFSKTIPTLNLGCFSIIFPCTSRFPKWSLSFNLTYKICVYMSYYLQSSWNASCCVNLVNWLFIHYNSNTSKTTFWSVTVVMDKQYYLQSLFFPILTVFHEKYNLSGSPWCPLL
jgi:hypothetical protein